MIELYNATEKLRKFNKQMKTNRVMMRFLENDGTKNLILHLQSKYSYSEVYKTRRGHNGGTWMCREMYEAFERWLYKLPNGTFERNELRFCAAMETAFGGLLSFERQKSFDSYVVDLYCVELKICLEYDESHHNRISNRVADGIRQKEIEEKFGVTFYRQAENESIFKTINYFVGMASMATWFLKSLPKPLGISR